MMDRRFDMMNFEQSLKDHADQFSLTPSKRVWNGIYNNLHPGSTWPSLTIAIVIFLTLVSIGYLNSSKKLTSKEAAVTTTSKVGSDSKPTNNDNFISGKESQAQTLRQSDNSSGANEGIGNERLFYNQDAGKKSAIKPVPQDQLNRSSILLKKSYSSNAKDLPGAGNNMVPGQVSIQNIPSGERNMYSSDITGNDIFSEDFDLMIKSVEVTPTTGIRLAPEYIGYSYTPLIFVNSEDVVSPAMKSANAPIDADIQEPKKTYPKKTHLKRNKNIEWIYYITPAISNALFNGNATSLSTINYSPLTLLQRSNSNGMMYNAKFGFETGAKMTYKLRKNWKFVTGFNLLYSDYNVVSNPIHPTFATLMLKDKASGVVYPKNYITFYGDGQSSYQTDLTNYSLQFAIPLGLEYQVWGNEKIQLNIASTIEPSLILKSHSYIISSDKRYYVEDPDLMRKMNLGANLGTFISFGSNNIKWHIGPDVHYQLLSTYKPAYQGKEHLINYGIRIGISKKY